MASTERSRLHSLLFAAPHLALALIASLRFLTSPDPRGYGTHEQLGFGACRFREWIGGPCPTCGVTTAASHLVHGDVLAAISVQPLGLVAPLVLLAMAAHAWAVHLRGGDLAASWIRHGRIFWSVLLVAVLACWAVA